MLFRDSILLTLGSGAGAFRSFGTFAFEPRPYQLVPLLMAMKQEPVRLLIADDVGIGKTIEAGMIAREWWERGEIRRFSVICPPHLVEQWRMELELKFHFQATVVNTKTAPGLESGLAPGTSLFETYPVTIVSLDFMKSERRRDDFALRCPEFVIVDEAHTAASSRGDGQLRQALLRKLAEKKDRNIVLLTATPHSGDELAFANLLGMLDDSFAGWNELKEENREALRKRLAGHFVQRRRGDVVDLSDGAFAKRESMEITYSMSGAYLNLFQDILRLYAAKKDLHIWTALSLLRSATSSPAALITSLRSTLAGRGVADEEEERIKVTEGGEDLLDDDSEGRSPLLSNLTDLLQRAETIEDTADPKLQRLLQLIKNLTDDGFHPVVFCRFISTAKYLGEQIGNHFKKITIDVVTGELSAEERRRKVDNLETLRDRGQPALLVATDCLSEGVNLQRIFNAVVHFDLSWNPMRHEQREGRVDRFGQPSPEVRTVILYGENNPVDELILNVIVKKAKKIKEELGVSVPVPELENSFYQGLLEFVKNMNAKKRDHGLQRELAFTIPESIQKMDVQWEARKEQEKKSRTIFAQQGIKPEEAIAEWQAASRFLGTAEDVDRFMLRSLSNLGINRSEKRHLDPGLLPENFKKRMKESGYEEPFRFVCHTRGDGIFLSRSHPVVQILARSFRDETLENSTVEGNLGRTGCWVSPAVERESMVLLLRFRHEVEEKPLDPQVVEESVVVAVSKQKGEWSVWNEDGLSLLIPPPAGKLTEKVRMERLEMALYGLPDLGEKLNQLAAKRAKRLLEDHNRLRLSVKAKGKTVVKNLTPVDILGCYLLLPE
jgi:superfamily II DNA/RNA helicase